MQLSLSSQNISVQVKFDMKQKSVATCLKVNMGWDNKQISSLLNSGSKITLIYQYYFEMKILPNIKQAGHQLFQLTATNNEKLPMSMYVE